MSNGLEGEILDDFCSIKGLHIFRNNCYKCFILSVPCGLSLQLPYSQPDSPLPMLNISVLKAHLMPEQVIVLGTTELSSSSCFTVAPSSLSSLLSLDCIPALPQPPPCVELGDECGLFVGRCCGGKLLMENRINY